MEEANPLPAKFRFYDGGEEYVLGHNAAKSAGRGRLLLLREVDTYFGRSCANKIKAKEIHSVLSKSADSEPLREVPRASSRIISDETVPYKLMRSTHAEIIPLRPNTKKGVVRPTNPMSGFFRLPHGMGSAGAEEEVQYIPIRLELEHDGIKVRDTFLWNANERTAQPRMVAECLAMDLELPASFKPLVKQAIQEQIDSYHTIMALPYPENRVVNIKLEVQVGRDLLVDQFLWDCDNQLNSPERFAQVTCAELRLGGEFVPIIAHSIREQLLHDRKLVGVMQEAMPLEDGATTDIFRLKSDMDEWSPALYSLSAQEVEKREQVESRESRRRRRATRGAPLEEDGSRSRRRSRRQSMFINSPMGTPTRARSPARSITGNVPAAKAAPGGREKPTPGVSKPSQDVLDYLKREGMGTDGLVSSALPPLVLVTAPEKDSTSGQQSTVPAKVRRSDGRFAFTDQVLTYLKQWLRQRMADRPGEGVAMPTEEERQELADRTGLSLKQISQWFQNRRKDFFGTSRGRNVGPCLERYLNS